MKSRQDQGTCIRILSPIINQNFSVIKSLAAFSSEDGNQINRKGQEAGDGGCQIRGCTCEGLSHFVAVELKRLMASLADHVAKQDGTESATDYENFGGENKEPWDLWP
ncbi:hypothetical protein CBL_01341 [Carabus blaptoides fortunei]